MCLYWWMQNSYYVLDCQNRNQCKPTLAGMLNQYGRLEEHAYFELTYEYDVTPLTTEQYEQNEQTTSVPLNRQFQWSAGFRVKSPLRVPVNKLSGCTYDEDYVPQQDGKARRYRQKHWGDKKPRTSSK